MLCRRPLNVRSDLFFSCVLLLILLCPQVRADDVPDRSGVWDLPGGDGVHLHLDQSGANLTGKFVSNTASWDVSGTVDEAGNIKLMRLIPLEELGNAPRHIITSVEQHHGAPGRPGFLQGRVEFTYHADSDSLTGFYVRLKPSWEGNQYLDTEEVETPMDLVRPLSGECKEKDEDGNYTIDMCDPKCAKKFWRFSLWVTNYNVDGSAGAGEHQGIGLFGHEYLFDERFTAADGNRRAWDQTDSDDKFIAAIAKLYDLDGEQAGGDKFIAAISNPDNELVEAAAFCEVSKTNFKLIYNHGRTLANQAAYWDFYSDPPMTRLISFTIGPLNPDQWQNASAPGMVKRTAAEKCVRQIKDGFCDSVCGNCSYVLPLGLGVGDFDTDHKIQHQREQFKIQETWAQKTYQVSYYQGKDPIWGDPTWGDGRGHDGPVVSYADPFTHCYLHDATGAQQALLSRFAWGNFDERVITGLFGHNSNTDAEAGYQHFAACAQDPVGTAGMSAGTPPLACNACGVPETANGKPIQYPCVMNRNTAREKWSREVLVSGLPVRTDGLHNIDSEAAGLGSSPSKGSPPVCLTNGQPVRGM
jgi:hypothetical protein